MIKKKNEMMIDFMSHLYPSFLKLIDDSGEREK